MTVRKGLNSSKKDHFQKIDVDKVMEKIRAELRNPGEKRGALPRSINPPIIKCKDLLLYEDEKFVKEAYKKLLHRLPEPDGLDFWLFRIRHLGWEKIKILWLVSKSHEGMIHNLHIRGLRSRYFFFKTGKILLGIPLIGWAFKLGLLFFRLPVSAP